MDAVEIESIILDLTEKHLARIYEHAGTAAKDAADRAVSAAESRLESKLQGVPENIRAMQGLTSGEISNTQNEISLLKTALEKSNEERARISSELEVNHKKHIEVLHDALAQERKDAALSNASYEAALQAKYDAMVTSFQERVKREQENRLKRSMEEVERAARKESERAKQAFEMQVVAEAAMGEKMKSILRDMRRQWEEEEIGRAKGIEMRLRAHYSTIVDNMETQLKVALRLQDDADKQWLEDVEARNKQQVQAMKAFEDKCRRLYDSRLAEYNEHTEKQLSEYEDQLMSQGSTLAMHKANFESRLKRMRVEAARWKTDYQSEMHAKYQVLADELEEKYMKEISALLEELMHARDQLAAAERALDGKISAAQYRKHAAAHSGHAKIAVDRLTKAGGKVGAVANTAIGRATGTAIEGSEVRMEGLVQLWNTLEVPLEQRLDALVALLDSTPMTKAMLSRYQEVESRLKQRQSIREMIAREQALEGHIGMLRQLADGSLDQPIEPNHLAALKLNSDELVSLRARLMEEKARFVDQYGERFSDSVPESMVDEQVRLLLAEMENGSSNLVSKQGGTLSSSQRKTLIKHSVQNQNSGGTPAETKTRPRKTDVQFFSPQSPKGSK